MKVKRTSGSGSKRGQTAIDVVVVIIFLFVMAIVVLFAGKLFTDVNTEIQSDDSLVSGAKEVSQTASGNFPALWDNLFIVALVLLWLFLIVTAFLIDTHPVFFIITLIILIFVFVAAAVFANTYEDFTEDEDMQPYAQHFRKMNYVFDHFVAVIILMSMSAGLALYAKSQL